MIQSVWKNLTGLQKAAEHLWCDFKCRPWAKNTKYQLQRNAINAALTEGAIDLVWGCIAPL